MADSGPPAVEVQGVSKSYGPIRALHEASFTVQTGEIFGVLGPNGAGKTTLLEIIEGLRRPDQGHVYVKGIDRLAHSKRVHALIGAQIEGAALFDRVTVWEIVDFFATIAGMRRRPEELIREFALESKRDAMVETLSRGQYQRLSLALTVVNEPEVIFLDEPTIGLDPQARSSLWESIRGLRARNRTVVLTTHYMEEAEALCNRVAILDQGQIIALERPQRLIERHARSSPTAELVLSRPLDLAAVLADVAQVYSQENETHYVLRILQMQPALAKLLYACEEQGVEIQSLSLRRPSLEDVFLNLTGRRLRE